MAFLIAPHASRIETLKGYGWTDESIAKVQATNVDIKQHLGLTANAKLPNEMNKFTDVPLGDGRTTILTVYSHVSHGTNRHGRVIKSSKHRTYARCPDCLEFVPAGRTHQHKCKGN